MKKYIIITYIILCSITTQASKGDSTFFKHQSGIGLSIYLIPPPNYTAFNGTFNYNVRYHFKILSANTSLSANINTGIGIPGLSVGYIFISRYFQFTLPVTINYNIGNGAKKNSKQSAGTYIGAGACLDFLAMPNSLRDNALSIGPVINTGFRFGSSSSDDSGSAKYDLRFSYMSTLNKNGKGLSDIFGLNLYYSF